MMKFEVWSDYVCPFCYIGKRELEQAIRETGLTGKVEVEFKAYELDPTTSTKDNAPVKESLMKKKGMSESQVEGMFESVTDRAKSVGLNYDFSKMKNANTKKAHRLAKFAESQGKGSDIDEALLAAHFTDNLALNDDEVLLSVAESVGLSREEAQAVLSSDQHADEVAQDIQEARALGVQGVPFFVLERKYAISGAQPQELFQETLKKVADEMGLKPGLQMMNDNDGGVCEDGSCTF
ncbi:Predicted dithiol-disulfide isomerase, DsbA family [Marinilactibacillus piezotolerans]|uniref:Predicted dithiol-disulfide isomerase, DsbA family n=1 Tax=Marinilactibacillus piezotolerans TaxID=258723 RepID=A0A1I3YMG0_9LACT|nr:DsbA family oxidoreductase [Marinilactibacillus piezotolerans]SFK33022.1 Predicted dithiol-disulfide isomerase, DsbA family [Marinilactibacillus piezotolerans]